MLAAFVYAGSLHSIASSAPTDVHRFLVETWRNLSKPPGDIIPRTVGALIVAVLTLLVARRLSARTRHALANTRMGTNPAVLVARSVRFTVWTAGAIWILTIYSVSFTALAAVVSVAALTLSLSLQDLLKNLIAGIYLLAERPFHIGDSITVKGVTGVIEDIEMRITYLRTERGERVVMPNQTVFTEVVINNTAQGSRTASITLDVPRSVTAGDVQSRVDDALAGIAALNGKPPRLEPVCLAPDSARWSLDLWIDPASGTSDIVLALGQALPESTISCGPA